MPQSHVALPRGGFEQCGHAWRRTGLTRKPANASKGSRMLESALGSMHLVSPARDGQYRKTLSGQHQQQPSSPLIEIPNVLNVLIIFIE